MAGPFMQGDMKGITSEEVSKLTKAMKDDTFRAHLDEYNREVSDPAHRKEYIQYLEQLEAKGEMPEGQSLLRTQPGCCVKTAIRFKNGQTQKLFINIVHTDTLDDFSIKDTDKGDKGGKQVYLPYSLSPPRPDRDLKDQYCMTADCAVSTYTFYQASQNPNLLKMVVDTAADGLAERFLKGYEEVKKDFKVMERMKCKGGFPMPMSVKADLLKDKGAAQKKKAARSAAEADAVTPSELKQMRADAKAKRDAFKDKGDGTAVNDDEEAASRASPKVEEQQQAGGPRIRVPRHRLIHSGSIDLADYMEAQGQPQAAVTTVPRSLRLIVELPSVKKSSDVSLEVTSNNVVVEVEDKFYLDLPLSYEVEDTNGTAKFDKSKSELILELPVVPKPPIFRPESVLSDQAAAGASGPGLEGELSEGGESDDEVGDGGDAGKDWIDRLPEAGNSGAAQAAETEETSTEKQAPPVKRERLEFEPSDHSLHIATSQAAPEDSEAPQGAAGERGEVEELPEDDEEEVDFDSLPGFIPASSFEGAKAGYYFSTGKEGLGYYKDLRQPRRRPAAAKAKQERTEPEQPTGPLVQEVFEPPARQAVEPVQRPPLPASLQRFVSESSALSQRLTQSECEASASAATELPLESYQNRHNIVVFIELPSGSAVADLQVVVTGHRLTVAFCTRPAASAEVADVRWKRHRLRRTLCGAADARQWHAEIEEGGSEPSARRLSLVFRKIRRGEMWPQVFDAAAAPAPSEPWEVASGTLLADGRPSAAVPSASSSASPAAAASSAPAAAVPASPSGGSAADEVREGAGHEAEVEEEALDSAGLDVGGEGAASGTSASGTPAQGPAAAAVAASVAAMAGGSQVTATAAMVQSAAVMGQSVLLKNRLMYQLL